MIKKTPEQVETISPKIILSSVGHGYNGKIWPQLLANHSACYIVHPLALYEHNIISVY